jgi:EmrB/QacA subfamily drug resistance transporter
MIFAVAMTFIDQTIVAIAVPELQKDLSLSSTGVQWIINGYLLSLSALFAFGGRLADIVGHKTMVIVGVIGFATASALCGATPTGDLGEAWMIFFRIVQGGFAALMFPAALAIVVAAFDIRERGKAMATFFGVTGGLTAIGPLAGGYLTEITWRAIFWVNVPVAIIALVLTVMSKPANEKHPAPLDYRGAVLVSGGMGLAVLGLQQSSEWGWGDPLTIGSIVIGLALLVAFVLYELRAKYPLIKVSIFRDRGFAIDNVLLFLMSMAFVPLFFFSSLYAQIGLEQSASEAGLYLLIFFGGFASAAQIGGRILDQRGARPSVVPGAIIAAAGFALWAQQLPDLDLNNQWYWIVMTGAGMGLMLGPASTDAVNHAPRTSYGEVTGITQTARNFGASLGLALLGTIFISENKSNVESSLASAGVPKARADQIADAVSHAGGGSTSGFSEQAGARARDLFDAVQHDFALASRTVFYIMAGVMALSFVVALIGMPRGRVESAEEPGKEPAPVG